MTYSPDFETFKTLHEQGFRVPIVRQLISDALTPVSAYCKIQSGSSAFLFESVIGGERVGRYSFLGTSPFLQFEAYRNRITITEEGKRTELTSEDPLRTFSEMVAKIKVVPHPMIPMFPCGAVGYAGYDVIRYSENLPNPPPDDRNLPDMSFAFFDRMVVFDQIQKAVRVVALAAQGGDSKQAYQGACDGVDEICRRLQRDSVELQTTDIDLTIPPTKKWVSNFTQEEFEERVRRCQEYIKAGDIFQVVIGQRWKSETSARPLDIYRALRVVNPSPFMFLLRTPEVTLVGSSPEVMVRSMDQEILIRPLAGTRPRGKTKEEDEALERDLLADAKERAEHVMLVDLARNDVGRVAKFGSVVVEDVMVVERYSHVMHITSHVTGKLAEGKTAIDALRAGLPAGTVSGAPKVRAMQIIDEMEKHRRGPYAGAVGYLDFAGNLDTCIALRTIVMQGQTAYVQAGAGIVADSVPEMEYQETLHKASGIFRAIAIAEQQL